MTITTWNQALLPASVRQAIAANPELFNRSITAAGDRANSVTIDMGGGGLMVNSGGWVK